MTDTANGEMIQLARESRGLTQKDLSERTGITQGHISKLERSELMPSPAQLEKIGATLDYPESFFFRQNRVVGLGISVIFNRRRKSLSPVALRRIQAAVNIRMMEIEKLLAGAEIESQNEFCRFDSEDFDGDAERIAALLRAKWRLPLGPVMNLIATIESAGGLVIKCDFGTNKLDALSHWDNGLPPIFFVNTDVPTDRLRFTLAHEIAHVVMHHVPTLDMEEQADHFASCFLMPRDEILPELALFSLERAMCLKRVWKVSIAALIIRACDLGVIPEWKKRKFFVAMGAAGYRTREPVQLEHEEPTTVHKLVSAHRDQLHHTTRSLGDLLSLTEQECSAIYPGVASQTHRFPSPFKAREA